MSTAQKNCHFFNTKTGCNNGDKCKFRHEKNQTGNEVENEVENEVGNEVYLVVEHELKKYCPANRISIICQKITGMLLEMTSEEISQFIENESSRSEKMTEAFEAIKQEQEVDVTLQKEIVSEIEKFKFLLSHVSSFFDNGRLEEVNAELAYTKIPFVKVGCIKFRTEKKNKYTCTFPNTEDTDFYMKLLSDISFQTNLRKELSNKCPRGYFTVKFLEEYDTLSIQAKHRI
jgi:hypothetical protein